MARATWVVVLLALVACPRKRRVGAPEIVAPTTGDAVARERFQRIQRVFHSDADKAPGTAVEFEAIAREYPDDPIVPHALLYAGISQLRAGESDRALENLNRIRDEPETDPAVIKRARVFRGIALNYQGDFGAAVAELQAARDYVNYRDREEHAEYLAALASSCAATERFSEAVVALDSWWRVARPSEREYIVNQVPVLVGRLEGGALGATWSALEHREGPGAAWVGQKMAAAFEARGEHDKAEDIRDEFSEAFESLGLATEESSDAGDPQIVGALLPLTGKLKLIGDVCLRALALVSGKFTGDGGDGARLSGFPRSFALLVRDTASSPAQIPQQIADLAGRGVVGVVGPFDGREVPLAVSSASKFGVPLITLTPSSSQVEPAPGVFHIRHSAEHRAGMLAKYAVAKGLREFAVMAPDNGYGRAVSAAFVAAVERLGGHVVVTVEYRSNATSFADVTAKLSKPWQAIFVPDTAQRLQLIAPALAAADLAVRPLGERPKHGRPVLLLSTAEAIDENFLRATGRYAWGAVLAPGFFPDRSDSRLAEFVSQYQDQFGVPPEPLDAYAFDAALVLRAVVEDGAQNRGQVTARLRAAEVAGLTGTIRFDGAGRRSDGGLLFSVQQIQTDQFELRVLRGHE